MKKNIILIIFISFVFMQGEIGGYAIFNYTGSTQQFDIDRSYLQYTNNISDDLFFKMRLDVGRDTDDTGDTKLSAYLKNAYVDWKCNSGGKFSIGLISTNSFGVQEKNWGYRFISKSVVDLYGMTKTADFGIGYSHDFGDFNMSMQLVNGEGYKENFDSGNDNDDKATLYLRLMYGEKKLNKNDGFNFGIVCDYNYKDNDNEFPNNIMYNNSLTGLFGAWAGYNFRLGAEHNSRKYEDGIIETASAVYFNYSVNDRMDLFLRHDMNDENIDDEWIDANSNGLDMASNTMLGMVWNATKGLYFAPNVTISQEGDNSDSVNEYRLTCMFKY